MGEKGVSSGVSVMKERGWIADSGVSQWGKSKVLTVVFQQWEESQKC
jgi:hypothetical protein